MTPKPKLGRPKKSDGPSVPHNIRLPRDLDEKVRAYARQHPELNNASVIRTGLRAWFSSIGFEPLGKVKNGV